MSPTHAKDSSVSTTLAIVPLADVQGKWIDVPRGNFFTRKLTAVIDWFLQDEARQGLAQYRKGQIINVADPAPTTCARSGASYRKHHAGTQPGCLRLRVFRQLRHHPAGTVPSSKLPVIQTTRPDGK